MTFDIQNGVLQKAEGSDTHAVIPDSVTVIGEYAFYYCPSLQSVLICPAFT